MIFFDSITASDIPADAPGVAGYVDGWFAWLATDWDRFPHARKLRIAVRAGTNDGDILDVETGDATPAQAPVWVAMRRRAGLLRPVIYCNVFTWPEVVLAMTRGGQSCDYLIADPAPLGAQAGALHTLQGAIGVQYAWPPLSGGHYDLSWIDDAWLNPLSQVEPVHYEEDNVTKLSMTVPALDDQGNGSFVVPGMAGRVSAVMVNGNDPNHQGYDGLKPTFEVSERGADDLVVVQGGKPHAGFGVRVWVAG